MNRLGGADHANEFSPPDGLASQCAALAEPAQYAALLRP